MIKKKKIFIAEDLPEFEASVNAMPDDSRIFVDKSLEIANYIFQVMENKNMKQKDLADALGKSEAEISKWLAGMHNYTLRSLSKLEAALGETIVCTPENYPAVRLTYSKRNKTSPIDQLIDNEHSKLVYPEHSAKVIQFKNKEIPTQSEAIAYSEAKAY